MVSSYCMTEEGRTLVLVSRDWPLSGGGGNITLETKVSPGDGVSSSKQWSAHSAGLRVSPGVGAALTRLAGLDRQADVAGSLTADIAWHLATSCSPSWHPHLQTRLLISPGNNQTWQSTGQQHLRHLTYFNSFYVWRRLSLWSPEDLISFHFANCNKNLSIIWSKKFENIKLMLVIHKNYRRRN